MSESVLPPNYAILTRRRHKALERQPTLFRPQEAAGCERTVITFSALIAACERDGAWELALQLFAQMLREGCAPNVITYNSLITALAAGGQWERAADAFGQLQRQGCEPDVVTYTALINAYEKGGQWRRAVQVMAITAWGAFILWDMQSVLLYWGTCGLLAVHVAQR